MWLSSSNWSKADPLTIRFSCFGPYLVSRLQKVSLVFPDPLSKRVAAPRHLSAILEHVQRANPSWAEVLLLRDFILHRKFHDCFRFFPVGFQDYEPECRWLVNNYGFHLCQRVPDVRRHLPHPKRTSCSQKRKPKSS